MSDPCFGKVSRSMRLKFQNLKLPTALEQQACRLQTLEKIRPHFEDKLLFIVPAFKRRNLMFCATDRLRGKMEASGDKFDALEDNLGLSTL